MSERVSSASQELFRTDSADELAAVRRKLIEAVHHYCPGWLSDVSEDLVQTAFIRVIEARRNRNDERGLSGSYLYKAAYSALVNEIRRRRRLREFPIEEERQETFHVSAGSIPNPERALATQRLGECILRCLATLLRDRKLAVTLHLQGYTLAEASRLLRWGRKRTENLIYRGLEDLRACLASQGIVP